MTFIHPRSEWADIAPHWAAPHRGVGDFFVHHEGGPSRGVPKSDAAKAAVLRAIEHNVLPKGYIATDYNLMIFQDGDLWEGRGLDHEDGATKDNNPTSVSLCAVGNFEYESAPDALILGIGGAVRLAASTGWTATKPRIRPHREVYPTACPGAHLYDRMNDIRIAAVNPSAPVPITRESLPMYMIIVEEYPDKTLGPTWMVSMDPATGKPRKAHMTDKDEIAVDKGLLENYGYANPIKHVTPGQAAKIPTAG